MATRLVEVQKLKKWFPIKGGVFSTTVASVKAVDEVSFFINQGETLGLVAVWEPDAALQQKYAKQFGLAAEIFSSDLDAMLDKTKPEAVATFTNTYDPRRWWWRRARRAISP